MEVRVYLDSRPHREQPSGGPWLWAAPPAPSRLAAAVEKEFISDGPEQTLSSEHLQFNRIKLSPKKIVHVSCGSIFSNVPVLKF